MLLCYAHHKKTDDVDQFSVRVLNQIKTDHEGQFRDATFAPRAQVLERLAAEMDEYWAVIAESSRVVREDRPFPMEIKVLSFGDVLSEINNTLNLLRHCVDKAYQPAPGDVNWDAYHIGVPNHFTHLDILLTQLEVLYLEQALANQPSDEELAARLADARHPLQGLSKSASHVD